MDGSGKRFNEGKIRYDLIPAFAQEQYARVLTYGAKKYGENGENGNDKNWTKGMKWTTVIASLERHLQAIKRGEDYDPESGLLHSAHLETNAAFLTEYYKIYPQGDDRVHWYKLRPKIGLDVDDVLADFVPAYDARFGVTSPNNWNFDLKIKERLDTLKDDKEFWMNIKPKIKPEDVPFEPYCYITSRICPTEWTEEWLEKNGFSCRKVYSSYDRNKSEIAKEVGIDWFVDDRFENFVELNNAGICCFLWDTPHNQRYDVGFKRIKNFLDLPLFR